jgi:hypothetical protein
MALILDLPPVIPEPPQAQALGTVSFRHPYNNHAFLALARVDTVRDPSSNTTTLMLHTKTALAACYIIHGFLALERGRAVAIQNQIMTDFLDAENVFYPTNDPNTPVRYPNFSPSSTPFAPGAVSQTVKARDKHCRTTKYNQGLIPCRLVPKSEAAWVCWNPKSS